MKYIGMQTIKMDANGNIIAEFPDGNMTDHSPDFSYIGSASKQVQAKFILQGQTVSFSVPSYDKTKQLVIDPFTSIWSVSPGFTTANDGYTIRIDYNKNVYVMGGGVSQGGGFIPSYKYQVKKFNSTGLLQWTATDLNSPNLGSYGDMIVLRSGKVIAAMGIGSGNTAYFLDPTNGAITTKNCPGSVNEFGWRLAYNLALNDGVLWAGGGSNNGAHLIKTDTNLNIATKYNPWNSTGGSVNTEDISYLAMDPTSSFVYVTNASNTNNNGVSGSTTAPNFCKVAEGTPATALWNKREPTLMMEVGQGGFMNPGATPFGGGWATGVNGMTVCGNAVYTFDGKNVRSYDPATGTITHTVATVGGVVDGFSGIAVDKCCRVYVGGSGKVYRYKDDLTLDTVIAVTGDVYDLQLDSLNDQHLFVTGKGFVQMLEGKDSYCISCITNTFVNTTISTKGSASVTVNDPSMILPLSYSWNTNPIQTGSVVTGLDPGTYIVTVTDGHPYCPKIWKDTISIILLEDPFSISIPNVFTPNNDNINDLFHIKAVGFSDMNVIIYNRWGKLIHKFDGINNSWDGTVSGKPAPDGVYYYIIEGQTYKNEKYNKSGFITLIR